MIIQKLKEVTRPNHDQAEQKAFAHKIKDGTLSYAEYRILIYGNYLFHYAVEQEIFRILTPEQQTRLGMEKRVKQHIIAAELKEIGFFLPDESEIPPFKIHTFFQALGALYVMEGSTLGGAMIKKMLLKNEQLIQKSPPLRLYGCYKENAGVYWKEFVEVFNTLDLNPAQEAEILDTAVATFALFETCFEAATKEVTG